MTEIAARYYDGRSSRALPVRVRLFEGGELRVEGEGVSLALRGDSIVVSERLGRAPRWLELADGARCELPDSESLDAWLTRHRASRSRGVVAALERRWGVAVVAAAVTLAGLAGAVFFGVPALADLVARSLPASVDSRLGAGALGALDRTFFEKSALAAGRSTEVNALFARLAAADATTAPRLELRGGGAIGANAFALPSGIVVVTDQLVELAADDAELAAVLAHELGHVRHRHALRAALQNAGVGILVAGALGDFVSVSSLAGGLPVLMVELQYSRRFEREADASAIETLREAGLDPLALARILERLAGAHGEGDVPLPAYLSSHPSTEERIRAIQAAR